MPVRTPPTWRLAVLALLAALIATLGLPGTAWAHTRLIDTSPADGATVARPPDALVLTFNERVLNQGTKVLVTGPDGSATRGGPRLAGTTVVQALRPDLPAGSYTVEWRVTSVDGHPISGELAFRVRAGAVTKATSAPATPEPSTSARRATPAGPPSATPATPVTPATPITPAAPGGGGSPWVWLLALIPLGIGAGWWLARRRR